MKKYLVILVAVLLAALPLMAGGQQEGGRQGAAETEQAPQEIKVAAAHFSGGSEGDMALLDPARRGTWSFHHLIWAPLVAGDTAGNYIPEKSLAQSYDVSTDGTVYTFHLRDAKFSDGTTITAQHVVDCFGHWGMMLHGEARGYRDNFAMAKRLMPDIVGMLAFIDENPYEEFGIGKPIPGIKVLDDKTVEITLEGPSITFLRRLMVSFSVFHPDDLTVGATIQYDINDYWPTKARSAGPYTIDSAVPGEKYTLVPNDHYFGPKPELEKIEILAVADDMNTILAAYQNGELDLIATPITGDYARQAMSDPKLADELVRVPTWQVLQLWITPNVPLDDVHVRRAFSMGLDKDLMVKILNAGAPMPLYERANMHRNPAVPDAIEETAAVKPLPFDPEMAKEELKKSKYWPDVLDMEIHLYAPDPSVVTIMETVQKMLTDNLGLTNVTIHNERIPDMMNPPFKLHLWNNGQMPWFADLIDTLKNMAWLVGEEPWKEGDHRPFIAVAYEPELRDLVEETFLENDPEKRSEMIGKIGQMWNDIAFSLDYAYPISYYLIKPYVKGFEWYQNAGQGVPLSIEDVRVESH
jgi:oligopeptide transport system substrate-binding protein